MSEKDKGDMERFALFIPIGVEETDRGFAVEWLEVSSDEEVAQQAEIRLFEETGASSWAKEEMMPDGSRGAKKFFFSGDKWKAPWQPKGPKPNWRTEANPNEPIN